MENQSSGKRWIRKGFLIGAVAGTVYVFINKNSRSKVIGGVEGFTSKTKHFIKVIKENRQSVLEQLRTSGQKIQYVIEDASSDIEKLVETSKHMKDHTMAIVSALQETKQEFQEFTEKLEDNNRATTMLPEREESPLKVSGAMPLPEELPSADKDKLN